MVPSKPSAVLTVTELSVCAEVLTGTVLSVCVEMSVVAAFFSDSGGGDRRSGRENLGVDLGSGTGSGSGCGCNETEGVADVGACT